MKESGLQASWNAGVVTIDASAAYHEAGAHPRHASVRSGPLPVLSAASRTARRLAPAVTVLAPCRTLQSRAQTSRTGAAASCEVRASLQWLQALSLRPHCVCMLTLLCWLAAALTQAACAPAADEPGTRYGDFVPIGASSRTLLPCKRVALGSRAYRSEPATHVSSTALASCSFGTRRARGAVPSLLPHVAGCNRGAARRALLDALSQTVHVMRLAPARACRAILLNALNRRPV